MLTPERMYGEKDDILEELMKQAVDSMDEYKSGKVSSSLFLSHVFLLFFSLSSFSLFYPLFPPFFFHTHS